MRITRMRLLGLGALVLALLAPAASAQSALQQMQDAAKAAASGTTSTLSSGAQAAEQVTGSAAAEAGLNMADMMAPVGSAAQVAFLQQVQKAKAIDPSAVFDQVIKSKAFSKILDNVEIQHRILENVPALKALSGFSEIQGRRLSDAETTAGFMKGIQTLSETIKTGIATVKNPNLVNEQIVELAKSDDPEIQALFKKNDEASVRQLQNLAGQKVFPGVDLAALQGVMDAMSFDKLVNQPEMQRFIDQDPYIAEKLRMPK